MKKRGCTAFFASCLGLVAACAITLGVTLSHVNVARANVSDLNYAGLRNPITVLAQTVACMNLSTTLDGGYVYYVQIYGGQGGTYGGVTRDEGGKVNAWFDARLLGDFTINYWVGDVGRSSTLVQAQGGDGYHKGGNGNAAGGGSSAIVLNGTLLVEAKGGDGAQYGSNTYGAGGGTTSSILENLSGTPNNLNFIPPVSGYCGRLAITRFDASNGSSITAGFSPNAVTGAGAGVTVN